MKKSNRKVYLYYATEENCFETEKHETTEPLNDVEQFLKDDYLQTDEIELAKYEMQCEFRKNGVAIYGTTQGQGYRIIIAIAKFGKCRKVTDMIAELRREAIAMCY